MTTTTTSKRFALAIRTSCPPPIPIRPQPNDFEDPPSWLNYVAEHLPLERVRITRDWNRFLAFLRAVALCRPRPSGRRPLDISFADYCVAYKIFEPALVASVREASLLESPAPVLQVRQAIVQLNKETGQGVTIRELAKHLNWNEKRIYKYVQRAAEDGVVDEEPGTRERNLKRFLPRVETTKTFLPRPKDILKANPEIGKKAKYIHPFTGKCKVIRR